MSEPLQTIPLDEEGYFILKDGVRLTDENEGSRLLSRMTLDENNACWTTWDGQKLLVEPFDKPLVIQQVSLTDTDLLLHAPYITTFTAELKTLCLDRWDRFHGLTRENHMPFVLTRKAQADLFHIAEDFDDDSITFFGKQYPTPPFYIENEEVSESAFWTAKYREGQPKWDLQGPHPALPAVLPQLKLIKSRILVLGCGRGHDAAYLAKQGHVVKGIDLSEHVVQEARKQYGDIHTLSLETGNALSMSLDHQYDIVFEHTLFCAISPLLRMDLVRQWKKALDVGGHLLGIFFVHPKRGGPPFGGSEWELRQLLEKDFRLLYWKRWTHSPEHRIGTEIVVYAQVRK